MELTEFFQNIKTPATMVHVGGVVVGMGAALVSDILFSFFSKDKNLNKTEMSTLSILANIVFYGLIIIAISGICIFFSDIEKYLASAKFLAKMTILLVLILNGYLLNKYIWPHLLNKNFFTLKRERNVRKLAFACGAVSVVSWLAVFSLGMLDNLAMSYGLIISIYAFIILISICVALFIEKKEFN